MKLKPKMMMILIDTALAKNGKLKPEMLKKLEMNY